MKISLLPSTSSRFIKFHFPEEVVVNGMVVTTNYFNTLKSFKVAANTRTSDPHDYTTEPQPLNMKFNVSIKYSPTLQSMHCELCTLKFEKESSLIGQSLYNSF